MTFDQDVGNDFILVKTELVGWMNLHNRLKII
jgi:hypothetical protein